MTTKYISLLSQTHYASLMKITILALLSNAQELSSFFLNKGFPLVSHLTASYVGASDIGHYIW